jgi:hypothetical protein
MYRYLFYRIYLATQSLQDENDLPEWGAASFLACLLWLNVLTVTIAAQLLIGVRLGWDVFTALTFSVGGSLLAFNYALFLRHRRWREIVARFEAENLGCRRVGTICVLTYVIGSIVAFFGIAGMLSHRTGLIGA